MNIDDEVLTESTSSYAKHWFGTLNNYTDIEEAQFVAFRGLLDYSVVGKEVGASGTPHLQFLLCFTKKIRFGALKKLLPKAALYLKATKGNTFVNASNYCKKGMFILFL